MDNKTKLYSISDAENFSIETVHDLYKNYINSSQVELIASFGFGNDLVKNSEGLIINTFNQKKILDFTGGVGVLNHGHNHPRILAARNKFSLEKRMEVHKNYFSPYLAALSFNMSTFLPDDLKISYFGNSGAEAVEGALKISHKFFDGERDIVLSSDISFHGKSIAASNITNSIETSYYSFQKTLKSDQFVYNDIDSVKEKIQKYKTENSSRIYSIIVEPFSASTLRSCSESFLFELRKICDEENIILIFDEIYSGWCKTGKTFYFLNFESLIPDILTSSKSLGGGKSSISCYSCKKEIFDKSYNNLKDATLHSTTYNAFGEETITAIEALNIIKDENFEEKSHIAGKLINNKLIKLKNKYPKIILDHRGSGCLHGIIINSSKFDEFLKPVMKLIPISFLKDDQAIKKIIVSSIIFHLYKNYNILTYYGSNKDIPLKISPSVVVKEEQINYFFSSLETTLNLGLFKLVKNFVGNKFFKKFKL
jgi:putrescine aminotransferase